MTTRPTRRPAKPAQPTASPTIPAVRPAKTGSEPKYHHGALHQALLGAAEIVLERDGLQGLTLRAVAREAGVSHAAPTHHFGDLTGLMSELAALGFRRFNAAMASTVTLSLRKTSIRNPGDTSPNFCTRL